MSEVYTLSPAVRISKTVWLLGCVSLLMDISSQMIHALLPVFMVTILGASATTVGAIEGIAEATALIGKPLFALANSPGWIFTARFIDRVGKGIRGAPRDALIADVTPQAIRGAAFGLRQALDTAGAFLGPLLGMGLMLSWANNFRAVFWVAVIPAFLALALLIFGVREPAATTQAENRSFPISRAALRKLSHRYWWVVAIGGALTLARFSEAFLVLRAQQGGLALALIPLVLIVMNIVYAGCAYPFGVLADKIRHRTLLGWGTLPLIGADLLLAHSGQLAWLGAGLVLWGLHMAATQGLLAAMVADTAPKELRGTAFGLFNLACGLAMLVASTLAGVLWDRLDASATFYAGALLACIALLLLLMRRA
jgi:MFS family permease